MDSSVIPINDAANAKKKSISGKAAAGVLIPVLFICLCVVVWFKMQPAKGKAKRKRWGEAVDKRISTDWKSILQQAHKPPSEILVPFLGLGSATLLYPLAHIGDDEDVGNVAGV